MKRDYALIIASMFVLSWANGMIYPVVPNYVKNLGNDNFMVGLSFALPSFVSIIMSFAWGMFSDRIGQRKSILIYGGLAASLLFFVQPYLDVIPLIIVRTLQQVFISSGILTYALVTEYYPKHKGRSIGDLQLFGGAGSTIGGFMVGLIITSQFMNIGSRELVAFFFICGALFLISTALFIPIKELEKEPAKKGLRDMLKFGDLKSARKTILAICLTAAVVQIAISMVYSIFTMYVKDIVIADSAEPTMVLGILCALASIGGIFGSYFSGRACDRFGRKRIFLVSLVLYFAAFLLYALSRNLYMIAVIWAIPIYSFYFISATAMVSDLTSDVERGRGMGILNSMIGVGAGLGALAGGYAAEFVDYQTVFAFSCIFIIVSLVIAVFLKETLKKNNRVISSGTEKPI